MIYSTNALSLSFQDEFIALCKTLYALLQDSANEEGLFQSMNSVAYKLLEIGKDNSECSSAAELGRASATVGGATPRTSVASDGAVAVDRSSISASEVVPTENRSGVEIVSAREDDSRGRGPSRLDAPTTDRQSSSSKSLADGALCCEDPVPKGSESQRATDSVDPGGVRSLRSPSSEFSSDDGFTLVSHEDCLPDDASRDDRNKAGSVRYITATENLSQQALQGVDWFLTFEQFISCLQHEPALCQFFAEQYMMDLMGSSVDPDLSAYTRSFMARKQ